MTAKCPRTDCRYWHRSMLPHCEEGACPCQGCHQPEFTRYSSTGGQKSDAVSANDYLTCPVCGMADHHKLSCSLRAPIKASAVERDPVLDLSTFVTKQVNAARERGIRDGLAAAGSADVVAMVDSMQAELTRLRESEAKAWGLVAEFVDSHDHGEAADELQSLHNSRAALAARKAGA